MHEVLPPVTISPFHMRLVFTISSQQSQGQWRLNAARTSLTRMKLSVTELLPSPKLLWPPSIKLFPAAWQSASRGPRVPRLQPRDRWSSSQKFCRWRGAKKPAKLAVTVSKQPCQRKAEVLRTRGASIPPGFGSAPEDADAVFLWTGP